MKKVLKIILLSITIIAMLALCIMFTYQHFNDDLNEMSLSIIRNTETGFVRYDDTKELIMNICDTSNNKIKDIPLDSLRTVLASNPWTTSVSASISLKGVLDVEVCECEPIMRIYNNKGKSIYIDKDGYIYPESSNYTPHLLICSGNIRFNPNEYGNVFDEKYSDTDLPIIFRIMTSVINDEYARTCVKQVFLDKNKNYNFSMNNTDIIVIFGDGNDVDEKLFKMEKFMKKMLGSTEIANYKSINLNFKDQVVCTKIK